MRNKNYEEFKTMRFEEIIFTNDEEFLRFTGIKQSTFNKMLDILKEAELKKFEKGGKPNKLSLENRLLMTILYLREYRTYFHIGKSFGISESGCYRNTI
jgi:Helix-turn-helix of DDE superfamily endonuclease